MFKTLPLLVLLAVVNCQIGNNSDWESAPKNVSGTSLEEVTEDSFVDKKGPSTLIPTIKLNSDNSGEGDQPCTMEDGTTGQCVPFFLCDINNTIVNDGAEIIEDVNFATRAVNRHSIKTSDGRSFCESYTDACCLPRDGQPSDNAIKPPPQPTREGACGWRNPRGADLTTTDETAENAKFGEFPWMVAIMNVEPVNEIKADDQKMKGYLCGGSLIAYNVVLTAAYFVVNSGALRIRAGEWDTRSTNEIYPFQDRDVSSVEIHKDFNKKNMFYDVALLFLSEPVTPAPNVGLACLPPPWQRTSAGTQCFATGWGKDKYGKEGRYQPILKKIELPVVNRNACQTALRKTIVGRFFQLHTSFMCAGGEEGKGTCQGDTGSPLSCPIPNDEGRYMQSGIVAWSMGCGVDGLPGVYVDVSIVREWIDEKILSRGLDPKTYTI